MARTKEIDRATISIFWQTGLQNRRELWLALLNPIGAICVSILVPLVIGKILAGLVNPGVDVMKYIPYFLAFALVGIITNRYGFANMLLYQAKTMNQLQTKALNALLRRSTGFHNNNIGGKLVSDAIDFPMGFALLVNAFFINLIPFAIILAVGSVVVFIESWIMGVLVLIMAAYALGSGIYESRQRAPLRARRLKVTKAVTAHLADTIVNVQTVKTFARENPELAKHRELGGELLKMRLSDWKQAGYAGNRRIAVLLAMQLVFVLLAIQLVRDNPDLLGVSIFAFSFSIMLANRLFEINTLLRNVEDGLLQASPMTEIILEDPEIKDAPGAKKLKVTKGALHLKDVDFEYKDSTNQQAVFANLNLNIKPGEKIGLVGPSGGGKSTLTRLMLRFDDIDKGIITIDDQNIAEVTQASLRQAISYVPQEPLLFHRSVNENIAYGNPDATTADIAKAAERANAAEFIDKLADGYETIVGERGVKLSGGQRQRIAIARAILKNAPILILDEATSALDSESELLIQDALWKLMKGRTAVVIAHRLSTIQKMDRIIVLEDGQITEEGTHKELLKQKGTYAKLWAHQSGGFLED
jgi:ATP-binding cassette subfamily B protein